jgi:hypothetical protein
MKEFIRVGGDLGNNYVQVQASESDDGRKQKRRFRIRVGTHNLRQPFQRAAPAGTFGWLRPVRGVRRPKPPAASAHLARWQWPECVAPYWGPRRLRPSPRTPQILAGNLTCRQAASAANQRHAAPSHLCVALGLPLESGSRAVESFIRFPLGERWRALQRTFRARP